MRPGGEVAGERSAAEGAADSGSLTPDGLVVDTATGELHSQGALAWGTPPVRESRYGWGTPAQSYPRPTVPAAERRWLQPVR